MSRNKIERDLYYEVFVAVCFAQLLLSKIEQHRTPQSKIRHKCLKSDPSVQNWTLVYKIEHWCLNSETSL